MKAMVSPPSKRIRICVWIAFAFLLVVSAANIFLMVHLLPSFQTIYHDLQGIKPLPSDTAFVIHWKFLFDCSALLWPVIGVWIISSTWTGNSLRIVLGLLLAAVLQVGFTTIVFFQPLIVDIQSTQPSR